MYGIVRSMVKIIESGRNDLTPQISNQKRKSRFASREFASDPSKQEQAILLYRDTCSLSQVSEFTGLSCSFVHNWLKEIGEHKPSGKSFSSICLPYSKQIKELYLSDISCDIIGKQLNFNEQSIRRLLKEMGVLKDTKPYQKLLDHTWLDYIDTEEKAYFLGLLASDGWLNRNSLFIDLQKRDEKLLVALRDRICPFIPLATYAPGKDNVQDKVRLVITSKRWRERCEEIGIGYRKSLSMPNIISNIPKNMRNHFIRGYFDGDGTVGVYLNKKLNKKFARVQLLGTEEFLEGIREEIGLSVGSITLSKTEKIHRLSYSGKKRLFELLDYLYNDATIFLQRKKDKFVW